MSWWSTGLRSTADSHSDSSQSYLTAPSALPGRDVAPYPSCMLSHRALTGVVLTASLLALSGCQPDVPALPSHAGSIQLVGGDQLFYRMVGTGPDTVVVVPAGPSLGSQYLESDSVTSVALTCWCSTICGGAAAPRSPNSRLVLPRPGCPRPRRAARLAAPRSGQLIGHQWGAGVALRFAIEQPAAVTRVVLLSPMAHRQDFIFELSLLPNDSAALARHVTARLAKVDSLDPASYCRTSGASPSRRWRRPPRPSSPHSRRTSAPTRLNGCVSVKRCSGSSISACRGGTGSTRSRR